MSIKFTQPLEKGKKNQSNVYLFGTIIILKLFPRKHRMQLNTI